MWPGMFDGLIRGMAVLLVLAFVAGFALHAAVSFAWPYLPSIRVVWP